MNSFVGDVLDWLAVVGWPIKSFLVLFVSAYFWLIYQDYKTLSHNNDDSAKKHQQVLLFDGHCNLCNSFVQTVQYFDRKKTISYLALQSTDGEAVMKKIGKDPKDLSSVIFVRRLFSEPHSWHEYYVKSDAILLILEAVGVPSLLISPLMILFPRIFRDFVYDCVATNRYRMFGKKSECNCGSPSADLLDIIYRE